MGIGCVTPPDSSHRNQVHRLLLLQQCMVSRPEASATGAASVNLRIAFSPEEIDAVINRELR